MPRSLKLAVLALVLLAIGAVAWRLAGPSRPAYAALTAVPGASGFEPAARPAGPVLRNKGGAAALDVDFRYAAADVSLALAFAPGDAAGTATIATRGDGVAATEVVPAVRRWDEPRRGYAVAVSDGTANHAPAAALCIKAVLGPRLDALDLADGTLCVARRDAGGACHPETLACGLLRPR